MDNKVGIKIKPIRNQKEYKGALDRIYYLMQLDLKTNSDEFDELELLSLLTEEYENKKYPIEFPDPIEAIKFRMEQLGIDRSVLVSVIGSKSRTSEILNRKRKLSLSMIRALNDKFNIPVSSLISEY